MINSCDNFYLIKDRTVLFWGMNLKESFEIEITNRLQKFIDKNVLPKNEVCEINEDVDVEFYHLCLSLRNDLNVNDARIELMKKLITIGISKENSIIIALDAGASQIIVNNDYINRFGYRQKTKAEALNAICQFYTGEV